MIPRHKSFSVVSRRSPVVASCVLAILLLVSLLSSSVPRLASAGAGRSQPTALSTSNAQDPPAGCCGGDEGDNKPHLLAGSYYTVKNHVSARVLLNNKGPVAIEVQPTFFSMSGERFEAPSVVVDGNTYQMIDLARIVAGAGHQFSEGSIQLFHRGKDLVLGAQIYLSDAAHSFSFDEKLSEPATSPSSRLAGVWWLPSPKGAVRLVISNTTDASISVTTKVRGKAPKMEASFQLELKAHETKVLDLERDLPGKSRGAMSSYGAISVEHNGALGGLVARAMAYDASVGYSLPIQFSNPTGGKSTSLQGAGLRIGKAGGESLSPKVVAHNAGDAQINVNGRVPYTNAEGVNAEVYLPPVQLAPGETEVIDLRSSLKAHGVQANVTAAGLEFEHDGAPGSLITSAFSVSKNGNQVFRVPLWDIVAQRSATGGYPWYIEGDSSTMVYIKNVTDEPRQYTLQLRYDGGVYAPGIKTLAARQTVALDLRALRDQQLPDESGRTIPRDATSGQVNWSMRGPQNQVLIGRSEQVDLASGISSNYACMNCCPDSFSGGWVDPGGIESFVGDNTQFNGFELTTNCYGSFNAPYNPWPNWDSSNWDVLGFCDGPGIGTADGLGTAYAQASWLAYEWGSFESGNPNECYERPINVLAEAVCEVLLSQIEFTEATYWTDVRSTFGLNIGRYTADLNIGGSERASSACGGGQFDIVAKFVLPQFHHQLRGAPFTKVTLSGSSQYRLVSGASGVPWEFVDVTEIRGEIHVTLQRNGEGNGTTVLITIAGVFQNGEHYTGRASVKLICPNP